MIDELVEAEMSLDALFARELAHRAGNALQTAIAAVHLGRRGGAHLDAAMERLTAAASLHAALGTPVVGQVDAASSVAAVCSAVRDASATGSGIEVIVVADAFQVDGGRLRPLLMIVAELVGNAVRYAFGDGRGRVSVRLVRQGEEIVLEVEDDGRCDGWSRPGGQGRGIVDGLARSMGGRVIRSRTPGGSAWVGVLVPAMVAAAMETGRS